MIKKNKNKILSVYNFEREGKYEKNKKIDFKSFRISGTKSRSIFNTSRKKILDRATYS